MFFYAASERWLTVLFRKKKKTHFFGNKTVDHRFGANLKKHVFCKILLQMFCFFSLLAQKMLKMAISTSVCSAQHPSAGRNIKHPQNPCPYFKQKSYVRCIKMRDLFLKFSVILRGTLTFLWIFNSCYDKIIWNVLGQIC